MYVGTCVHMYVSTYEWWWSVLVGWPLKNRIIPSTYLHLYVHQLRNVGRRSNVNGTATCTRTTSCPSNPGRGWPSGQRACVTRFGEILPKCQNFKSFGNFLWFDLYFKSTLANIYYIGQIIIVVKGQIIYPSSHTATVRTVYSDWSQCKPIYFDFL